MAKLWKNMLAEKCRAWIAKICGEWLALLYWWVHQEICCHMASALHEVGSNSSLSLKDDTVPMAYFLTLFSTENTYSSHKPWSALHPLPTRQQCRRGQDPSFKGFQEKSIGDFRRSTHETNVGYLLIFASEVVPWATYTRVYVEIYTQSKECLFQFSTLPKRCTV